MFKMLFYLLVMATICTTCFIPFNVHPKLILLQIDESVEICVVFTGENILIRVQHEMLCVLK